MSPGPRTQETGPARGRPIRTGPDYGSDAVPIWEERYCMKGY